MKLKSFPKFCSRFIVTISNRFKSIGKGSEDKMKVFVQKRNPISGNTEWDVGVDHDEYDYHQEIARSAFADMLHDTERNQMYYKALEIAIQKMHRDGKKANVLDIGTGTGLLSMMAAKCGADTVTACEAFKPMADCCSKILAKNGFADKIKLIPKRSTEITVGKGGDMEQRANILVTEVFDTELIGEGAVGTFAHAHAELLEEGCVVVPDSAVLYAQLVDCDFLHRFHRLRDPAAPELGAELRTPEKMRRCAGSAAVHDVQLSQLAAGAARALSPRLAALRYAWARARGAPPRRLARRAFAARAAGPAHAVLMWWELNMDQEGSIVLSCAPWWEHPLAEAAARAEHPADAVPWRDHWMQAVYYLPREAHLREGQEATLVVCQDEYSLWFYLEEQGADATGTASTDDGQDDAGDAGIADITATVATAADMAPYPRPACTCGVHAAWSRAHIARLNAGLRGQAARLARLLRPDSVLLDLNGSSFLGLLAARRARKVYILEPSRYNAAILQDYADANGLTNVHIIPEITAAVAEEVTETSFDPARAGALLPWEELAPALSLRALRRAGAPGRPGEPGRAALWALPVAFLDLHKIRVPVRSCEGFDVDIFDQLVERSRAAADAALEPQPLWEYPARAAGRPRRLLSLDFQDLQPSYRAQGSFALSDESASDEEPSYPLNGFAVWLAWGAPGAEPEPAPGAEPEPAPGAEPEPAPAPPGRVRWDPHQKYAVHLLRAPVCARAGATWSYRLSCDLDRGDFRLRLGLDPL